MVKLPVYLIFIWLLTHVMGWMVLLIWGVVAHLRVQGWAGIRVELRYLTSRPEKMKFFDLAQSQLLM
jgi:hypothetical protein